MDYFAYHNLWGIPFRSAILPCTPVLPTLRSSRVERSTSSDVRGDCFQTNRLKILRGKKTIERNVLFLCPYLPKLTGNSIYRGRSVSDVTKKNRGSFGTVRGITEWGRGVGVGLKEGSGERRVERRGEERRGWPRHRSASRHYFECDAEERRRRADEPRNARKTGVFSNDDDNAVFARLARPPGSSHFRGITNAAGSLRGTRH